MTKSRCPTTQRGSRLVIGLLGIPWALVIGHWSFDANAAAPTLDHFFPVAVQLGTTNTVTAIGKFDPWPAKVWADAPGLAFKPETNSGKFSIEVATNTPIGPHLVRVYNEQGASGPRFLIVAREPQLAELEPNDEFKKPQVIEHLPASINGRLDKSGDVDSFAVELQTGQTLMASVEAFTLASPVDAVLRVVDARGVQVAINHDGSTLDPFLVWSAKSAGTYVVQVFGFSYPADSDVKFTGRNNCVYRLHLSRGPCLRHTLPIGVQRGVRTSLQVAGWNLRQHDGLSFDGTDLPADATQTTLQVPGFDNTILLPVGEGPESMEHEPNGVAAEANRLEVPGAVTGYIETAGDEDRFSFTAKKGGKFLLEVQSAGLGFPLDAWLRIENLEGKELAKNDDNGNADPKLEWTASEDGAFVAAVGNVLHRGSAEHLYRLAIRRAVPAVTINASETAFTITAGNSNEIKVAIKPLHGFQQKLKVAVRGLPDGLLAEPADVPDKGGDVTLKLMASPEADPFSGPIQIIATEVESQKEHRAVADLTSSTVNNGVPGGFNKLVIESTDQLWLTVLPVPVIRTETRK